MLKPKTYLMLERCVEEGVEYGLGRAYKHDDDPPHEVISEHIQREVMNQICEWFNIGEDDGDE